jgi:hypothetical protein
MVQHTLLQMVYNLRPVCLIFLVQKYFRTKNVFRTENVLKIFLYEKLPYENGYRTKTHMRNCQMFFIFLYNLRN